jgi:hypothetical protein
MIDAHLLCTLELRWDKRTHPARRFRYEHLACAPVVSRGIVSSVVAPYNAAVRPSSKRKLGSNSIL